MEQALWGHLMMIGLNLIAWLRNQDERKDGGEQEAHYISTVNGSLDKDAIQREEGNNELLLHDY